MAGQHVVLLAPTGNGKSLCYQLPALLKPGVALVVSPLIALMQDQVDALKARGIEAEFLNSQLSWDARQQVKRNVGSGRTKLLYVSPEGLSANEGLRQSLPNLNVSLFAIDEAHCISEWGHDFREEYRKLGQVRELIPDVPVIALTATATRRTLGDIVGQLQVGVSGMKTVRVSLNRENLRYEVRRKPSMAAALQMLEDEIRALNGGSVIVYCAKRDTTEEVAAYLATRGIAADHYHAGIEGQRASKQSDFMEGRTQVVVATIAFGMGIDKEDIRLVVHWDMPKSIEAYYQETGRAGRDGKPAECLLLYSPEAANTQRFFANRHSAVAMQEHANRNVDRIQNLCVTSLCRRRVMLEHFGESVEDDCDGCDNCTDERQRVDVTDLARTVIDAVLITGSIFGTQHISAVVRGRRTPKLVEESHHHLPIFGLARLNTAEQVSEVIQAMIDAGMMVIPPGKFRSLQVSERGKRWRKSSETMTARLKSKSADAPTQTQSSIRSGRPPMDVNSKLLAELKLLRLKIAREVGKPAFMIFSDATLLDMARAMPTTMPQMLEVSGVGEVKLRAYGLRFLAVIKSYTE